MRHERLRVAKPGELAGIKYGRLTNLANLIQQRLTTTKHYRLRITIK